MLAILFVLYFILKVMLINTFALVSAPVSTALLYELFGTLLVSSGAYSQSQVDAMDWNEMSNVVEYEVSQGNIKPADVVVDGNLKYLDWLSEKSKESSTMSKLMFKAYELWVDDLGYEHIGLTPIIDLEGFGCSIVDVKETHTNIYFCDYAERSRNSGGALVLYSNEEGANRVLWRVIDNRGKIVSETYSDVLSLSWYSNFAFYGDVRYFDGTAAPTDAMTEAQVGENAEGETVTLDDIQAGDVPVGDVAFDWTKFDDTAIIDLLNQILAVLDNAPVISEDNSIAEDVVGDVTVELDISELNNLQMPLGITDVFPFCIPFDFVRGMKLLSAEPETPYFEANIVVPSFFGVPEQRWDFVIDLKMFEPVAIITRWTCLLSFSYVLIILTGKIVKGAGA